MEITNISKPKKIKKYPIISIELSKEKTIRKTIKEGYRGNAEKRR